MKKKASVSKKKLFDISEKVDKILAAVFNL